MQLLFEVHEFTLLFVELKDLWEYYINLPPKLISSY
jgi:hypothetical protein